MAMELENIVANTVYLKAREGEGIVLAYRVCTYLLVASQKAVRYFRIFIVRLKAGSCVAGLEVHTGAALGCCFYSVICSPYYC